MMRKSPKKAWQQHISAENLAEILDYDAESGRLFWKDRGAEWFSSNRDMLRWNRIFAGREALTADNYGYRRGNILGKSYMAHRVGWAIHHGKWPDRGLDHINGNPSDNRIANLRLADQSENTQNAAIRSDNKSGFPGVYWCKFKSKWVASITLRGKRTHLGSFRDVAEAIDAYRAAKGRLHTFQPTVRGGISAP